MCYRYRHSDMTRHRDVTHYVTQAPATDITTGTIHRRNIISAFQRTMTIYFSPYPDVGLIIPSVL